MTDPTTLAARLRTRAYQNAVCHCGDYLKDHRGYENHSPVPMLNEDEELDIKAADTIDALQAKLAKFEAAFTSMDGVLLAPGDTAYYSRGCRWVGTDDFNGPNEDGKFYEPADPEDIIVGNCSPYWCEDTLAAPELWASRDNALADARREADKQNMQAAKDIAAEAARNTKE